MDNKINNKTNAQIKTLPESQKKSKSNPSLWSKCKKILNKIKESYNSHLENILNIADSENPAAQSKISIKKTVHSYKNLK